MDVRGVIADAWRLWKRDSDLLLRIAGAFLFLPTFALHLVVPSPPAFTAESELNEAQQLEMARGFVAWAGANGGWYLLSTLLIYAGLLTILVLYQDAARPDLRAAFARAARLFGRYVLAMIVIGIPVTIGLWSIVLLLPGLYLLGRMFAVGPILVGEAPIGLRGALARSWALTKGNGLVLAGFSALTMLGGGIAAAPFLAIDRSLRAGGADNPLVIAAVDAAAAAMATAALLAMVLLQVAIYRRLAARQGN